MTNYKRKEQTRHDHKDENGKKHKKEHNRDEWNKSERIRTKRANYRQHATRTDLKRQEQECTDKNKQTIYNRQESIRTEHMMRT